MSRTLKTVFAAVMAAGLAFGVMAQGVPMQTVQDSASGNRLIINGQPLFISGMNLAWHNFANDVGDNAVSRSTMTNYIKQIRNAGGNAMRWWLHTDATKCPKFDGNGKVTGLGTQTINNIRTVLDSAHAYGVVVSLCLFSFDILHNDGGNKTPAQMSNNQKFMTEPANLDSYIEHALKPMLEAVGSHPAIMCWEVFNEPEGMANGYGWATTKIDHSHIIRFTAKIAGEVRRNTKKMASTGIHNFHNYVSLYTTPKLTAIDPDGWLDFYMAHHYPEYESKSQSPFYNPASHWGFDRPVLIGEFPAQSWGPGGYPHYYENKPLDIKEAYEYAYKNGYCGAMSWSMTEGNKSKFGSFATTAPALTYMFDKYKSDIEIKGGSGNIDIPSGDLAMKFVLNNMPQEGTAPNGGPWNFVKKDGDQNFAGKTNLTFELFVEQGSASALTITPVVQMNTTGSGGKEWHWSPAHDASIVVGDYTAGEWHTITVPINKFIPDSENAAPNFSQVKSVVLQFFSKGSTAYTGTIYIDNIKVDGTTLFNFNDALTDLWPEGEDMSSGVSISIAPRPGTSSVRYGAKVTNATRHMPVIAVKGKMLNVTGLDDSPMTVKLINVNGKIAARFNAQGKGQFSLAKIPAGRYFVEIKKAGKRVNASAVTVR